jgi:hypothetical protein
MNFIHITHIIYALFFTHFYTGVLTREFYSQDFLHRSSSREFLYRSSYTRVNFRRYLRRSWLLGDLLVSEHLQKSYFSSSSKFSD